MHHDCITSIVNDRVKFFREKSSAWIEWPEFGASFELDCCADELAAGQTGRRMPAQTWNNYSAVSAVKVG